MIITVGGGFTEWAIKYKTATGPGSFTPYKCGKMPSYFAKSGKYQGCES